MKSQHRHRGQPTLQRWDQIFPDKAMGLYAAIDPTSFHHASIFLR